MKPHQYLRIALAAAVLAAIGIGLWLDIPTSTFRLIGLAALVVGGLVYLGLALAGVVEPPWNRPWTRRRPPARGRMENGRFIDDSGDPAYSGQGAGGLPFLVEAALDVKDLIDGRGRKTRDDPSRDR